jgi:hypothetical protein
MKPFNLRSPRAILGLVASLACLGLSTGCTHTRMVNLRYTPLIQTQRLADRNSVTVVNVGGFTDAREGKSLTEHRPNPINVHKFKYETKDDVAALVRSAFVDAMLKSGFEVPLPGVTAENPMLNISGKVIHFDAGTKIGWSKITVAAVAEVEITLTPRSGAPVTFTVKGEELQEQKDFMNVESTVPDALDRALRKCIEAFLTDSRLQQTVKP